MFYRMNGERRYRALNWSTAVCLMHYNASYMQPGISSGNENPIVQITSSKVFTDIPYSVSPHGPPLKSVGCPHNTPSARPLAFYPSRVQSRPGSVGSLMLDTWP
jgi:hypothetical protein